MDIERVTPTAENSLIDEAACATVTQQPAKSRSGLEVVPEKPPPITIIGADGEHKKSLESLLEEFAGHWEIRDENLVRYRNVWNKYVPKFKREDNNQLILLNAEYCVAYNPIVCVRKCYPLAVKGKVSELPYFIVILNSARDERPQQVAKHIGDPKDASGKDPLQENLIDKGMIIAEFDNFYLCPNGYPYHRYASLLIARNPSRQQDYPTPAEIEAWMRFSMLTRQFVFFNSPHAGASIPKRLHAQVVDPAGIRAEDSQIIYPLVNGKITKRRAVRKGIEVLESYGIEALVLRGMDAPHRASQAVRKIRDEQGHWYNVMISGKEVFVVARNAEKETSHCIGKRVGAYEMSGVILVGNIEEKLMDELDLDRVVTGAEIFSQLSYEQISSNIANATASLGGIEHEL